MFTTAVIFIWSLIIRSIKAYFVGTSSAMVAATALMGFIGHTVNGNFDLTYAIYLALIAVVAGFIGSKFALKRKPKNLKKSLQ